MVAKQLEDAIGTGEIVRIAYAGGSQPGSERDIYPLEVKGDKVRAKCIASGAMKTFDVAKISIIRLVAPDPTPAATYDPSAPRAPTIQHFQSFEHIAVELTPALASMGWHVDQEADGDNRALSLQSFFKNGKLRKTPDVTLHYTPMTYDAIAGADGNIYEANHRASTRPWTVRSRGLPSGVAYGKIDRAVQAFLEQAEKLAPTAT